MNNKFDEDDYDDSTSVDVSRMFNESPEVMEYLSEFPKSKGGEENSLNHRRCKKLNISFPKLLNGDCMFLNSQLEEITSEFPKLLSGYCMFCNSKNLKKVTSSFPMLIDGSNMFENCNLDADTINKILDSLPTWNDGEEHIITFTGCSGLKDCDVSIGTSKGWTVEI